MSIPRILAKLDAMRQLLPAQGELTDTGLALYARKISDIPLEAIDRAIDRALDVCEWFPGPAKLRELAGVPKPEDAAVFAWDTAWGAISTVGAYRSVAFDDPLIAAAIRHLGGWEAFCRMTADEAPFRRRDFLAAYLACSRNGLTADQASHLPGLHEASGRAIEPVRIGSDAPRLPPAEAARLAEARRLRSLPPAPSEPVEDRGDGVAALVGWLAGDAQ